jgi:hypothetical protein
MFKPLAMRSRSLVLAISVCLLGVGLFFLVRIFLSRSAGATPDTVDTSIAEQAAREVPRPTPPPQPAGSTLSTSTIQVPKGVPMIRRTPAPPGGAPAQGPKTIVERHFESVEIKVAKGGANASQDAAYNQQVEAQEKAYNAAVIARMDAIAAEKASSGSAGGMEGILDLIEKGIVPLISAITGLILAIKSLRSPTPSPS